MKRTATGSRQERSIIRWSMFLAGFLVVLDQISKIVIVQQIPEHHVIPLIRGFFNLTYVNNPGAAWGILAGKGWLLLMISIVVFIVIVFFMKALTEGWTERYIAIFMIISGIIGNSIDRVWRHQVVDFLDFYVSFSGKDYHFPAFNVADSAITVGITIFIISSMFRPQEKKLPSIVFQK